MCDLPAVASFMNMKVSKDKWPFWIPLTFQVLFWRCKCWIRETWPLLWEAYVLAAVVITNSKKTLLNSYFHKYAKGRKQESETEKVIGRPPWRRVIRRTPSQEPAMTEAWCVRCGLRGWKGVQEEGTLHPCTRRSCMGKGVGCIGGTKGSWWGWSVENEGGTGPGGVARHARTPGLSHQRICPVSKSHGGTLVDTKLELTQLPWSLGK